MEKQKELVKNTLIIAVGKLSTQFLTFLLLPVYTAFLAPEEYGTLDLVLVYMGVLVPVFTVQMEMAVFRHLIDARQDNSKISKILSSSLVVLVIGAIVGVLALGTYGLISMSNLTPYIIGVFLSIVCINYFLQVARGLGRNDIFATTSVIVGLSNIGISLVAVVLLHQSITGILSALIIANFIGTIFLIIKTHYWQYVNADTPDKKTTKILLSYAWPLVPNHISLWGIGGISRTIVAGALGLAALGVYAAASKFTLIYTSLYSIFAMSWTESVSLHINKPGDFLSNTTNSTVRLFGSLTLLIIASSGLLFPILVADNFGEARYFIPLLVVGGFFGSLVTHYGAIYLAAKDTVKVAKITLQAVIISTALTLIGIWFIGLYAPAVAIVVTYLFIAVRRHYDIQKYVQIHYAKGLFWKLVACASLVFMLYYINTLVTDVISVLVALLTAVLLSKNEITKIVNMALRKRRF